MSGGVSILGVRHHGPGSARAVRRELERLRPDAILIEGPPEADALIPLAPGLEPPVALLAHVPGAPSRAAFWPFAVFSPEWQAILYGTAAGIPVRFCDLPAAHTLAGDAESPAGDQDESFPGDEAARSLMRVDPIGALAAAAGYDDPERWWEDVVEHRGGDTPFEVIAEAMAAVREGHVPDEREARREAYMRKTLRAALKQGYGRIAVICGAWHVPALSGPLPSAAADNAVLRGLPKVKAELTWVPWTYGRLASWSGYGAGITSPGWYHHLFEAPDRPVERWLAQAAGVLRDEGLAVSSAHVIESVRLAHGLATLRGRPLAGLGEVTEAARAVLCEGDDLAVELIQRRMVVGDRLGHVSDGTPMVPLQRDLREQQRRLKLKPEALDREIDLDLRKPLDLDRSHLLHRLGLLGVEWGTPGQARGKGTFRETWTLRWRPEHDLALIEHAALGTTVASAAAQRARDLAEEPSAALADLTSLVERCLLADLTGALPAVLAALSAKAALDTDVTSLMAALPAMVRAHRYGDVRGTPAEGLAVIVRSMLERICVGLPVAVTSLDDEAAANLLKHVDAVHSAVALLSDAPEAGGGDKGAGTGGGTGAGSDAGNGPGGDAGNGAGGHGAGPRGRWLGTLRGISDRQDLHGLIEGRLTRILLDSGELDDAGDRMSRAMSRGQAPARAAAWVEGFLAGGGLLLVHDPRLLGLVDGWLTGLSGEQFTDVLPLLRRTFGSFAAPERRAIGERLRAADRGEEAGEQAVDERRAAPAVATVLSILGKAGTREGTTGR
ncbi:unnamed protein product [[Actinomadura] parvosata subsp. kistnae]|uniref:Uncharacterized protein n=1 Tax=[Actinomadura] parvosata subsp. kistnae TaxID=1909395 RepID=A0A1U9ZR87_9ACTN|nr:DUF5682 family protein [Nonomuraea sp. ATCC 55076]AQZ60460.1 hypothetical protein BKM31_02055 [Nonomuraea sp. ATCC 55076]SPL90999.1 unnamed protein product [Actinomadura parvosata subsp. kistnae]